MQSNRAANQATDFNSMQNAMFVTSFLDHIFHSTVQKAHPALTQKVARITFPILNYILREYGH